MTEDRPRPTKKQREMLTFIENFIAGNGFGPSYREIMRGLGYKTVSVVVHHVDNLIAAGYLAKKDHTARSLEVVGSSRKVAVKGEKVARSEERWLIDRIEAHFMGVESQGAPVQEEVDQLYVLVGALKVLGLESAQKAFAKRLSIVKKKVAK